MSVILRCCSSGEVGVDAKEKNHERDQLWRSPTSQSRAGSDYLVGWKIISHSIRFGQMLNSPPTMEVWMSILYQLTEYKLFLTQTQSIKKKKSKSFLLLPSSCCIGNYINMKVLVLSQILSCAKNSLLDAWWTSPCPNSSSTLFCYKSQWWKA